MTPDTLEARLLKLVNRWRDIASQSERRGGSATSECADELAALLAESRPRPAEPLDSLVETYCQVAFAGGASPATLTSLRHFVRWVQTRSADVAPRPPASAAPPQHPVATFLAGVESYDLFAPEIVLEEDGDLDISWGNELSVSLTRGGQAAWAALIPPFKAHGSFAVAQTWPADFYEALVTLAEFQNQQLLAASAAPSEWQAKDEKGKL